MTFACYTSRILTKQPVPDLYMQYYIKPIAAQVIVNLMDDIVATKVKVATAAL